MRYEEVRLLVQSGGRRPTGQPKDTAAARRTKPSGRRALADETFVHVVGQFPRVSESRLGRAVLSALHGHS